MITKEERIVLMARGYQGPIPKHYSVAAEVLDTLAKELVKQGFKYQEDKSWPFQLLVCSGPGRSSSLFTGGFRRDIEVQPLKEDGTADTRFKEERFSTPKGAVNYLRRKME